MTPRSKGKEDQAIAYYREALSQKPDSAQALNNLAMILVTSESHRDPAEAVHLAKRATEMKPDDPEQIQEKR